MCCPSVLIFLFKSNKAKMHSQKNFSLFLCDASVPVPNGHIIKQVCSIEQNFFLALIYFFFLQSGSWCQFDLSQPTNAREMRCNAPICHMPCLNDNCTLLCEGPRQASCFPTCIGKGCIIKCNSYLCVANCTRGHCDVDFGPKSSGKLHCDGGHCKLTCQHGENPVSTIYRAPCKIMSCPNNTCTLKMIPKSDARITLVTSVAVLAGLLATLLFSQS